MPIVLYHTVGSPPCSTVRVVAAYLNIPLTLKPVDLLSGEQLKPEFLRINPHHTVPTIEDNGLILWESNAIIMYLVEQYTPDSPLYPKCPRLRAPINRFLFMNENTLYENIMNFYRPQWFQQKLPDNKLLEKVKDVLKQYETILSANSTPFLCGDSLTLADATALSALMVPFEITEFKEVCEYPAVRSYYQRAKTAFEPHFSSVNSDAIALFKQWIRAMNYTS